jgi:hypothetical protein
MKETLLGSSLWSLVKSNGIAVQWFSDLMKGPTQWIHLREYSGGIELICVNQESLCQRLLIKCLRVPVLKWLTQEYHSTRILELILWILCLQYPRILLNHQKALLAAGPSGVLVVNSPRSSMDT